MRLPWRRKPEPVPNAFRKPARLEGGIDIFFGGNETHPYEYCPHCGAGTNNLASHIARKHDTR